MSPAQDFPFVLLCFIFVCAKVKWPKLDLNKTSAASRNAWITSPTFSSRSQRAEIDR